MADSSNYFSIAVADDQAMSSHRASPVEDVPSPREQRIAAAVIRSRTEYKAEHAYTERKWFHSVTPNDKQRLEFLVTSLYYSSPPEYARVLSLVREAYDPSAKSLGGLTREVLDTGIRAALACGDVNYAVKLADTSKSLWRGQAAGAAVMAADAYLAAGRPYDAVEPILISCSSGVHLPLIQRLDRALDEIEGLEALHSVVKGFVQRREAAVQPLLGESKRVMTASFEEAPVDVEATARILRVDPTLLEATLRRLRRRAEAEMQERSVREL